jgi:hypothetical membrane protein
VVAGPLFVVVFLIEGATRDGYDPLRQPVSALALGPLGWMQQANFILTGVLMVACAFGLRTALHRWGGSTAAPALVAVAGIGLVGAGIFVMGGSLHIPFSMLFFLGLPAASIVLGRRFAGWGQPGWARYSILTGIGCLAAFGLAFVALGSSAGPLGDMAGLIQRVAAVIGFTWLTLLSIRLLTLGES